MPMRRSRGELLANAQNFADLYENGCILLFSGVQPASSNEGIGTSVLLGRMTLNGGAFVFGQPNNGLLFEAVYTGSLVVARKPLTAAWRITAIATGDVGWGRVCANTGSEADYLTASTTRHSRDISVGTTGTNLLLSGRRLNQGSITNIDGFSIVFREEAD